MTRVIRTMRHTFVSFAVLAILIADYFKVHAFLKNTFIKSNVTNILCTSGLAPLNTVRSRLDCSQLCGKIEGCNGFFYLSTNKNCQITTYNVVDVSLPDPACSDIAGVNYYYKDHGNHGTICASNATCVGPDVMCWNGICKCIPGYSLNPDNHKCQAECDVYASDFTTYKNQTLALANSNAYSNMTVQECLNVCVVDGCRTARYHYPTLSCRTDTRTPVTDPGCLTPNTELDLFVRNCESNY